ncbi:MAG: hypothetical protein ABSH38_22325, partial [Verrucomicrobiota bacterium]
PVHMAPFHGTRAKNPEISPPLGLTSPLMPLQAPNLPNTTDSQFSMFFNSGRGFWKVIENYRGHSCG